MSPRKVGKKGLVIHSQGREIIKNVSEFMEKEAKQGSSIIPLSNHRERTIAAVKISRSTYQRIKKESQHVDPNVPSTSFVTPRKERPRQSRKLDAITEGQLKDIREIVYDFYILEKRRPTLKLIMQKIIDREILTEPIGLTSLTSLLKKIGFKWQKTDDNRKALVEGYDIRIKRINFLKEIIRHREEGRTIIYTDETYIHSSHTQEKGWFDSSSKGIRKPISKGQRLIIVHAGSKNGFIQDGLLIFKSGSKSGDYHSDMNHQNFMKWVEKQLLPNMPPNSTLVVDNASYHNVPLKKNITLASKKIEMIAWLKEKEIAVDEKLTKPEIYKIIQDNKFRFPIKFKLDELLEQHGHRVLHLPPYHPELNPIEKIWANVKNWVASRNVTFKLSDVEALTRQRFMEITTEEWANVCQHVEKHEQTLIEKEHIFDDTFDSLKFTVNTGSSEESDSDDSSESSLECAPLSDSE